MERENPFKNIPMKDPHDDFPDREEYDGYQLYGRFYPRLQSSRHTKYRVWVERAEPVASFDVDVVVPVIEVIDIPGAKLMEMMKAQAFSKARELIDSSTYGYDKIHTINFNRR